MTYLAFCYEHGQGVTLDLDQAQLWYTAALPKEFSTHVVDPEEYTVLD